MVPCPITVHTLTSRGALATPVWMYPNSWARRWSPRPHHAAQAGQSAERLQTASAINLARLATLGLHHGANGWAMAAADRQLPGI
jgi:hypothetical protein